KGEGALSLADLGHAAGEFFEILCLAEVLIDAGEADIGDRIEALQPLHHQFADALRGDFGVAQRFELSLDAGDELFDLHRADRALAARGRDRADELVALERFAPVVGLEDDEVAKLDTLEGGEARRARLALPPPPDRRPVLGGAAV